MVLIDGYNILKSTRKNKKYDVYKEGKYVTSFGDTRYSHYKDKISNEWAHLDHNDKDRRRLYRLRHAKDNINDKNSAGYWAWHYLW